MSASRPSASVVVCTYSMKRWDDLMAAIRSLELQSVVPSQVIVVVDHNPELLARVRTTFGGVVVVDNPEWRGLSAARNAGLTVATGDVVAFLDDDARAEAGWLETLLSAYADESVLGVGGTVRPAWEAGRPVWFPAEFDWVVGCTYLGLPTTSAAIRNLIGCNMSFRRQAVLSVGGFQVGRVGELSVGCEDDETELCIRLRQLWPGARIIYKPDAAVDHRVATDRSTWSYFWIRCWSEGLSKAMLSAGVGSNDALSSEIAYVLRTLTRGWLRGVTDSVRRGQAASLLRALAITTGLCAAAAGYAAGRLGLRRPHQPKRTPARLLSPRLPIDLPSA